MRTASSLFFPTILFSCSAFSQIDSLSVLKGRLIDRCGNPLLDADLILMPRLDTSHLSLSADIKRLLEMKTERLWVLINDHKFNIERQVNRFREDGSFSFTHLPPGSYTLLVLRTGFAPALREGISLDGTDTARITIVLRESVSDNDSVFYDTPTSDQVQSYSETLRAFKEPPFFSPIDTSELHSSYRFLWLRHSLHPILIRIDFLKNGSGVGYLKETDGIGGYYNGKLIHTKKVDVLKVLRGQMESKDLGQSRIDFFREKASYPIWGAPYRIDADPYSIVLHGSTWIVEAIKPGRMHLVERSSPSLSDPVASFAWSLVRLFDIEFKHGEVF